MSGSTVYAGGQFTRMEDFPCRGNAAISDPLSDVPPSRIPQQVRLLSPQPNLSRDQVAMVFSLPSPQTVDAALFDAAGRLPRAIANGGEFPAGQCTLVWDGRFRSGIPAQSGVYLFRFRSGSMSQVQKGLLSR